MNCPNCRKELPAGTKIWKDKVESIKAKSYEPVNLLAGSCIEIIRRADERARS
jgi:hypothetical protein